jgi:predicted metal-dependent peptidase
MPLLISPITIHDRLIRAMVKIQSEYAFFSYILMNFKISAEEDPLIPSAGVSKAGDFMYNSDFIKNLDDSELIGLLIHEVMHIAKGDFFRQGNRDHNIWGIASDCIINFILKQEGFTLPKNGYLPDQYGNISIGGKKYCVSKKSTEQFYDELYIDADKIHIVLNNNREGNKDSGSDKSGKNDSQEDDCGCDGYDPSENSSHGNFDIHINCGESSSQNAQSESKWKKVIIEAATNARTRGTMPGCMLSVVDKLLNPTIDWRTRVMKFITSEIPVDYSNRLPNRTFYATGVWAPRVIRENLEVFISVDVSGSTINDRETFITEVAAILSSYEQIHARLIFWDAVVHEENDFEITKNNKDCLTSLKIKDCNGGTSLSSYQEYLERKDYKCRLHIIFTDGFLENTPKIPDGNIIFVLSQNGNDSIVKNYGAICRITDKGE